MNIPSKSRKRITPVKQRGNIGDQIRFVRRDLIIEGIIQMVKENVAIVEIGRSESLDLNLENELTVVAHKNYEVIQCVESKISS